MADYKRQFMAAVLACVALLSVPAAAAGERVCAQGCSFSGIQEALNAAAPNETVTVESARYNESFVAGKPVVLQGLDTGTGRPILSPDSGRVILAALGSTMQGFEVAAPSNPEEGNCTLEVVMPASIFLNDFASKESVCPDVASSWNTSQPMNYQYNSRVLRSRLGNYWADYTGRDENADGIGDEPKVIDEENKDFYPLIQPVENYVISGEKETRVKLISARVGEPFTISLPANPTTAYEWTADYDYYLLELSSSQFEKSTSEAVGAGGMSIFVFKPLHPGKTTIALVYKRPWENIVADTRKILVEIQAGK